jgi:hypothetical protein
MTLPFPFAHPVWVVRVTPTTSAARNRLRAAFRTWSVDGSKDVVAVGDGVSEFETFLVSNPSSVR